MKLLIITGAYPPQVCGVGDYVKQLMGTNVAIEWKLYFSKDWGIGSLLKHIRSINKTCIDALNMQYPTQGYGWSIVPHLLCMWFSWFSFKQFSVTIHEYSQMSLKARILEWFILASANRVIFTNQFERDYAIRRVPFIGRRSTVIKIFSNIPSKEDIKPINTRVYDIVNFGHIRPYKGLEKFIKDVSALADLYRVAIVGQVPDGFESYYKHIAEYCHELHIEIILDLNDIQVSDLLNNTKLVYLPFPDGASERRGSLLASFANGAVVLTSVGKFTTYKLRDSIVNSEEYSITEVLSNKVLLRSKQVKSLSYIKKEMPHGWNDVASQYNIFLECQKVTYNKLQNWEMNRKK